MVGASGESTVASVGEHGWRVARGEYDGHAVVVRCNPAFAAVGDRADWPVRIGVALVVREPDGVGFPGKEEGDELGRAEDEVVRLAGGRAVIVAVLTVKGVRELVLHARASDWIEQFHHDAQAAISTHEVQVIAQLDPEWQAFGEIAEPFLA